MLKYLFLIILGILLYILLNRKDRFSIGIPDEAEIQSLIDDINRILGERGETDETDTENLDRLSGYLEGLTDDEFNTLATSLDDDDKKLQYFLDVRKYIKIGYGIEQLYAYYTNTGVTLEELQSEELGISFSDEVWSSPDGKYSIYKQDLDTDITIEQARELLGRFNKSGNSKPYYAISGGYPWKTMTDYIPRSSISIYYFFETYEHKKILRGRIGTNIYLPQKLQEEAELAASQEGVPLAEYMEQVIQKATEKDKLIKLFNLTIFPVGHGLGDHFFRILENHNLIINRFIPEDNAKRAYRRLFHLSVTPKDYGGFSDNGYFTLFRPDETTAKRLYGTLYDGLGKLKSEYTHNQKCLFLMSIDLDDIEDLVKNPEELEGYLNDEELSIPLSEKVVAYQQSSETSSGAPATGCSA